MAFVVKDWHDSPTEDTPVSAAGLEDLEFRLAAYTDSLIAVDGAANVGTMRTLGTGGNQAAAGNDSRLTNSRAPNGSAGGDLNGTYPNPTIANNAVTAAKVASGTLTDVQVAAANKDGAVTAPSLRTIGPGALQAASGNDYRIITPWKPSSALAENMPRYDATISGIALVSGILSLAGGISIPAGTAVNSISIVSGTQAAAGPSNQWFCLVDQSLNVLAKTVDDVNTAWGANSVKTLNLSAPYTATTSIGVYVGVLFNGTTPPTLIGSQPIAALANIVPKLAGPSTTGLTNPASLGGTAAAISAAGSAFYAYVS